jgi:hypothetical protein
VAEIFDLDLHTKHLASLVGFNRAAIICLHAFVCLPLERVSLVSTVRR